jgi:hypothetical protein
MIGDHAPNFPSKSQYWRFRFDHEFKIYLFASVHVFQ